MFWHARTISKFLLKRPELQRDTLEIEPFSFKNGFKKYGAGE